MLTQYQVKPGYNLLELPFFICIFVIFIEIKDAFQLGLDLSKLVFSPLGGGGLVFFDIVGPKRFKNAQLYWGFDVGVEFIIEVDAVVYEIFSKGFDCFYLRKVRICDLCKVVTEIVFWDSDDAKVLMHFCSELGRDLELLQACCI